MGRINDNNPLLAPDTLFNTAHRYRSTTGGDKPRTLLRFMDRRSIRYEGFDYSMAGYYALTLCARDKAHLFGVLPPDEPLQPSPLGELISHELLAIPTHYPTVRLDTWLLMPNHLHLILTLTRNQVVAVSQVMGGFKSRCYGQWRRAQLAAGRPTPPSCWQRNYYERIVRDAAELDAHRRYILDNPNRWNH